MVRYAWGKDDFNCLSFSYIIANFRAVQPINYIKNKWMVCSGS